ncbi:MAG: hypothetical protein WKF30_16095 [Pyrinomonadaceae bacterium]
MRATTGDGRITPTDSMALPKLTEDVAWLRGRFSRLDARNGDGAIC